MIDAQDFINKVAEVSTAVAFQANEPSVDFAGAVISHLAAHPEHLGEFMADGAGLFIDGKMSLTSGCLSHRCNDGVIRQSSEIRELTGAQSN